MRRRRSNPELRHELIEAETRMLDLMVGVGADDDAAKTRAHIAELESGRSVVVRASDVGHPQDEGWVRLGVDGSITALSEAPSRARVGTFQGSLNGRR
jgi:hypothetical protein